MNASENAGPSFAAALGRVPSGLYILTARHNGQNFAMLASWVQQASFEPPAISVAIGRGRPIGDPIRTAGAFAVSIIAEQDSALMKRFAAGAPEPDPLAGCALVEPAGPVPVLADALAWLQCTLIDVVDFEADHELFLGRVESGDVLREGKAWSHHRKDGLHY